MTMIKNKMSEREEIEALLPWHAAGTLSRREAQKVEQALALDADLAAQYATIRKSRCRRRIRVRFCGSA